MRTLLVVVLCGEMLVSLARAQSSPPPSMLMPMPAKLQTGSGQLALDPSFSVTTTGYTDARLRRAVNRFLNQLRLETGMLPLDMNLVRGPAATLVIRTEPRQPTGARLGRG